MKTRNFEQLQDFLINLHKTKTLREIAKEAFDGKINHAAIDRCIKGCEPRDIQIRKTFGLPEIIAQEFWRNEKGQRVKTP